MSDSSKWQDASYPDPIFPPRAPFPSCCWPFLPPESLPPAAAPKTLALIGSCLSCAACANVRPQFLHASSSTAAAAASPRRSAALPHPPSSPNAAAAPLATPVRPGRRSLLPPSPLPPSLLPRRPRVASASQRCTAWRAVPEPPPGKSSRSGHRAPAPAGCIPQISPR